MVRNSLSIHTTLLIELFESFWLCPGMIVISLNMLCLNMHTISLIQWFSRFYFLRFFFHIFVLSLSCVFFSSFHDQLWINSDSLHAFSIRFLWIHLYTKLIKRIPIFYYCIWWSSAIIWWFDVCFLFNREKAKNAIEIVASLTKRIYIEIESYQTYFCGRIICMYKKSGEKK